jgi:hypothetical protein
VVHLVESLSPLSSCALQNIWDDEHARARVRPANVFNIGIISLMSSFLRMIFKHLRDLINYESHIHIQLTAIFDFTNLLSLSSCVLRNLQMEITAQRAECGLEEIHFFIIHRTVRDKILIRFLLMCFSLFILYFSREEGERARGDGSSNENFFFSLSLSLSGYQSATVSIL